VSHSGADILVTVGENAKYIQDGLLPDNKPATVHFEKTRAAAQYVRELVRDGDVVLVKASRGMKFEMIVENIAKLTEEEQQ
jgi:UDP-N-acetylmuramoyl-tripeptide--D-alanyl-D-alanine ligase